MDSLHGMYDLPESERETDIAYQAMVPRMRAFIFPTVPQSEDEIAAFTKAILYQIEHEAKQAEALNGTVLPDGVSSFKIGDFSMSFADADSDQRLSRKTICPSAYGVLLTAGLLYRGVEGRLYHGVD